MLKVFRIPHISLSLSTSWLPWCKQPAVMLVLAVVIFCSALGYKAGQPANHRLKTATLSQKTFSSCKLFSSGVLPSFFRGSCFPDAQLSLLVFYICLFFSNAFNSLLSFLFKFLSFSSAVFFSEGIIHCAYL